MNSWKRIEKFEELEKRLISEATVLEGAVYHHYNDDGVLQGYLKVYH